MYPYLGVELACRTKALMLKALSGEVRAQPLSRGGSGLWVKAQHESTVQRSCDR